MVREENGHNYDEKISLLISLILSFILFSSFYFISILLAFCSLVTEDEKGFFFF